MELYIIRHGHTAWNKEHRFQGQTDNPLDGLGFKQVSTLGKAVEGLKLQALYTSPLIRARQTAAPVEKATGLSAQPDARLMEPYFGPWEGLTKTEIEALDAQQLHYFWYEPEKWNAEGVEGFIRVLERSQSFMRDVMEAYSDKRIGIVTHGYFSAVTIASLLGESYAELNRWLPDNASVSGLKFENGKWQLLFYSNTDHMGTDHA